MANFVQNKPLKMSPDSFCQHFGGNIIKTTVNKRVKTFFWDTLFVSSILYGCIPQKFGKLENID